jgi:elongation factor P
MTLAKQISVGMTLLIDGDIYRVEQPPKMVPVKGLQLINVSLRHLVTDHLTEKRFKPDQTVQEVTPVPKTLEFLYPEGNEYKFLDIGSLDIVGIPANKLGNKIHFLKEGIKIFSIHYADTYFSGELEPILELMVVKTEPADMGAGSSATKIAQLETGARLLVPLFVEAGDVLKIDTQRQEESKGDFFPHAFMQRV